MQLLQTEIFDWVNQKNFNLDFYSNNNAIDCFLKVNFDYPDEMYVLHYSYNCMTCRRNIVEISITNHRR